MGFLDFTEEKDIDYKTMSDEDILTLSLSKPEVFSVLIDRYEEPFLRKVKNIVRSDEDSEDIVQQVFTKIYLNANSFKKQEGASFKSWGYKILMNTSFTYYQKLKKKNQNTAELTEIMEKIIEDPLTSDYLGKKEVSDYVARVMTKLPKSLSRILHLHFIERFSQKDIAKMEGISLGAVKTRIYRAKKEFRDISKYNFV
jgi:RNA polymerase sigma factor (sigma-70 family)